MKKSLALLERPCSLAQKGEPAVSGLFSSLLEEISQEKGISPDLLGKFIDRIEVFQSCEGEEGRKGRKLQRIRIYYRVLDPEKEGNGLA